MTLGSGCTLAAVTAERRLTHVELLYRPGERELAIRLFTLLGCDPVDRGGQLLVAPVHAALRIHPVAFLIGDRQGRWGALDRQGDPLIDVVHATEAEVVEEIDRLLADTRPVL